MKTNRPMNEYEGALFSAVLILGDAVAKLGASESDLLSKFKQARNDADADGRKNEAATLGLFIKFLFEPPEYYRSR
jgi:hypothetical protein